MQHAVQVLGANFMADELCNAAVMPVQLLADRRNVATAEHALALAVVQDAVNLLRKHADGRGNRREKRELELARAWIASDDRRWPFSFENLCDMLDMDAEKIRKNLADPDLLDAGRIAHGR